MLALGLVIALHATRRLGEPLPGQLRETPAFRQDLAGGLALVYASGDLLLDDAQLGRVWRMNRSSCGGICRCATHGHPL